MILQRVYDNLEKYIEPNKVLVLYGPRRVGKTTLVKQYLEKTKYSYRFDTGDDIRIQEILSSENLEKIRSYVGEAELVVLDEAQNIPNIGIALKLMVDHIPGIKIIATGSASFQLANSIGEPLVGRQWTKTLYPISQYELTQSTSAFDLQNALEQRLIYGSYPEIFTASSNDRRRQILLEITGSYLLKDILALENIRRSHVLVQLLRLLAFQIGSEVSLSEIGNQLEIDKKTVARYLDLLEKSFVLYPLESFSRNMRKAISKKKKYYFWDLGIRNALITNFNSLDTRDDIGKLWENFIVMERVKTQSYKPIYANNYFWRTWDKKEVDWVEMRGGKLHGYEIKWKKKASKNKAYWLQAYPNEATFEYINSENYLSFLK
jgi:predicted AAA+ superfamily ATPase